MRYAEDGALKIDNNPARLVLDLTPRVTTKKSAIRLSTRLQCCIVHHLVITLVGYTEHICVPVSLIDLCDERRARH